MSQIKNSQQLNALTQQFDQSLRTTDPSFKGYDPKLASLFPEIKVDVVYRPLTEEELRTPKKPFEVFQNIQETPCLSQGGILIVPSPVLNSPPEPYSFKALLKTGALKRVLMVLIPHANAVTDDHIVDAVVSLAQHMESRSVVDWLDLITLLTLPYLWSSASVEQATLFMQELPRGVFAVYRPISTLIVNKILNRKPLGFPFYSNAHMDTLANVFIMPSAPYSVTYKPKGRNTPHPERAAMNVQKKIIEEQAPSQILSRTDAIPIPKKQPVFFDLAGKPTLDTQERLKTNANTKKEIVSAQAKDLHARVVQRNEAIKKVEQEVISKMQEEVKPRFVIKKTFVKPASRLPIKKPSIYEEVNEVTRKRTKKEGVDSLEGSASSKFAKKKVITEKTQLAFYSTAAVRASQDGLTANTPASIIANSENLPPEYTHSEFVPKKASKNASAKVIHRTLEVISGAAKNADKTMMHLPIHATQANLGEIKKLRLTQKDVSEYQRIVQENLDKTPLLAPANAIGMNTTVMMIGNPDEPQFGELVNNVLTVQPSKKATTIVSAGIPHTTMTFRTVFPSPYDTEVSDSAGYLPEYNSSLFHYSHLAVASLLESTADNKVGMDRFRNSVAGEMERNRFSSGTPMGQMIRYCKCKQAQSSTVYKSVYDCYKDNFLSTSANLEFMDHKAVASMALSPLFNDFNTKASSGLMYADYKKCIPTTICDVAQIQMYEKKGYQTPELWYQYEFKPKYELTPMSQMLHKTRSIFVANSASQLIAQMVFHNTYAFERDYSDFDSIIDNRNLLGITQQEFIKMLIAHPPERNKAWAFSDNLYVWEASSRKLYSLDGAKMESQVKPKHVEDVSKALLDAYVALGNTECYLQTEATEEELQRCFPGIYNEYSEIAVSKQGVVPSYLDPWAQSGATMSLSGILSMLCVYEKLEMKRFVVEGTLVIVLNKRKRQPAKLVKEYMLDTLPSLLERSVGVFANHTLNLGFLPSGWASTSIMNTCVTMLLVDEFFENYSNNVQGFLKAVRSNSFPFARFTVEAEGTPFEDCKLDFLGFDVVDGALTLRETSLLSSPFWLNFSAYTSSYAKQCAILLAKWMSAMYNGAVNNEFMVAVFKTLCEHLVRDGALQFDPEFVTEMAVVMSNCATMEDFVVSAFENCNLVGAEYPDYITHGFEFKLEEILAIRKSSYDEAFELFRKSPDFSKEVYALLYLINIDAATNHKITSEALTKYIASKIYSLFKNDPSQLQGVLDQYTLGEVSDVFPPPKGVDDEFFNSRRTSLMEYVNARFAKAKAEDAAYKDAKRKLADEDEAAYQARKQKTGGRRKNKVSKHVEKRPVQA